LDGKKMKNNPVAIFTGLAVATAVGLGAIIYSRQPGPEAEKPTQAAVSEPAVPEKPADATAEKKPEAAPPQTEQAAKTEELAAVTAPVPEASTGQEQAAKTEEPAAEATPAPQAAKPEEAKAPEQKPESEAAAKPTFDTVRVEPEGDTLAAGQALPGAEVTLKRNGEVVGKAQANAEGDWVVVTEAPLPKGASELSVEQKPSNSQQVVASDQSIAVVVPENPTQKAMVALVEPGMPTQVLQKAETIAASEPAAKAESPSETTQQTAAKQEPAADASAAGEAKTEAAAEPPVSETAKTTTEPAAATADTPAPAASAPETKTALADPASEPAKTEEPVTEPPAAEPPAAATPTLETPVAKPGAPVTLDAVDYNSSGDIVFSGSAAPGSVVRIYVDNNPVGDALADSAGRWTFAGTEKVAPGGHSLRVDQIDTQGKVMSRVELPFIREDAARVAEMTAPQSEPQKPAEAVKAAPAEPETTAKSEPEMPAPTASETSESAAASADPALAPKPETAAPATQPETEVAKTGEGTEIAKTEEPAAKTEEPAVAATEQPAVKTEEPAVAATEQPAAKTEEPAVAAVEEPAAQPEAVEQSTAASEPATIESESSATAGVAATATQQTGQAEPAQQKKGRVIIQPGNNLWKLSRVIYGKGISYTVIYEANKGQIRDPDMIYPGQIFATPNVVPPETIDPKRKKPLSAEEGGTTVQ